MSITTIVLLVLVLLMGAPLVFLILAGFFYLTRGNPVQGVRVLGSETSAPDVSDEHFIMQVELHVNTHLSAGNQVEVLFNGEEVYPRLWDDLRSAERLITWHVFWFKPSSLASQLSDILIERVRSGVQVLVLYDAYGAQGTDSDYWETLRQAGIEVHPFRPFRWHEMYKWQERTHMRTVVIDGRVGYTGGFAIHDDWLGDGRHADQWRDTSVRI